MKFTVKDMMHLRLTGRMPPARTPVMPDEDVRLIRRYAAGEEGLKGEAIQAHRRNILALGVRGTPEQRFMAEVDHPVPDLNLRRLYREELARA